MPSKSPDQVAESPTPLDYRIVSPDEAWSMVRVNINGLIDLLEHLHLRRSWRLQRALRKSLRSLERALSTLHDVGDKAFDQASWHNIGHRLQQREQSWIVQRGRQDVD